MLVQTSTAEMDTVTPVVLKTNTFGMSATDTRSVQSTHQEWEFRIDGGVLVQGYFVRGGLNQATSGISEID